MKKCKEAKMDNKPVWMKRLWDFFFFFLTQVTAASVKVSRKHAEREQRRGQV